MSQYVKGDGIVSAIPLRTTFDAAGKSHTIAKLFVTVLLELDLNSTELIEILKRQPLLSHLTQQIYQPKAEETIQDSGVAEGPVRRGVGDLYE